MKASDAAIDGQIIEMSPMGAPRIGVINRLNMRLAPALVGRAVVQVRGPLGLSTSRPEPDLAVLPLNDGRRAGFTEGWVVDLEVVSLSAFPDVALAGDPEALGSRGLCGRAELGHTRGVGASRG